MHINLFNAPTLSKLMGGWTVMVHGQNDDRSTLDEWLSTPQGRELMPVLALSNEMGCAWLRCIMNPSILAYDCEMFIKTAFISLL